MDRVTRRLFGGLLLALLVAAMVVMRAGDDDAVRASTPVDEWSLPGVELNRADDFLRGVALGLYYREQWRDYEGPLEEIARLGADTVSIVVTWSQPTIHDADIGPDHAESRDDAIVERTIRLAHEEGVRVMLFPILKVEERNSGEWRGTIAPENVSDWFDAYAAYILHYAEMGEEYGVELLSVGSELGSMERYESRWRQLIARVRTVYSGQLLYSANWDHYRQTTFWDAVDLIGLTGYYELADSADAVVTVTSLSKAWAPIRDRLVGFARETGRPFVFTEVGYYSQAGTAWHPWDYTRTGPVDLEAQLICYRAFYEVWRDIPELTGVFFWHWWGDGGPEDGSYNPRGKPAEEVIRHWFTQYPSSTRERRR